MFIGRKVVLMLRNVYVIKCSFGGKSFLSCGMYVLSHVYQEESCFKVAECLYHHVFIWRKVFLKLRNVHVITRQVVLKLRNVDIITCSSGGKWF